MPEDYSKLPSNSQMPRKAGDKRKQPKEKPKVEPVVTGKVRTRRPGLGRQIKESFTGDSLQSVAEYVVIDVAVPAAKSMITDMFKEGIERVMWGDSGPRRTTGVSPTMRIATTNYTRYAAPAIKSGARELSSRARSAHDFEEIVLDTREEAANVIDKINDLIEEYEVATVADLYDLAGYTSEFTDQKWGWTDIRGAQVRRIREGFLIELPRPVVIG